MIVSNEDYDAWVQRLRGALSKCNFDKGQIDQTTRQPVTKPQLAVGP